MTMDLGVMSIIERFTNIALQPIENACIMLFEVVKSDDNGAVDADDDDSS